MKKVLLVATVQSHICQFHRPLVGMLHDEGIIVHVAARNNLAEKNGLKLDFADKVFDLPFSRSPKSKDNLKAYKQLKKIIDEEKYDVIHCNTPMGGIVTRLAAKKARKQGCKVVYTAHGFHFYKGASKKNWLVYYPIEKIFAKKTDLLITINQEDYETAKARFSCPVERIHGVGVDPDRYHPVSPEEQGVLKEKLGLDEDKRYLLCVGELLPNKNQIMAIRAMKTVARELPDTVLLIAGNGSEKENLERGIIDTGVENNVKLIGYVTNLQEYQRVCEIAVSCSKREGLGLNLIEAMLSGNSVVATRNRGHNELVKEGINGYLVDIGDSDTLAERLISILKGTSGISTADVAESVASYTKGAVYQELKSIYTNHIFSQQ